MSGCSTGVWSQTSHLQSSRLSFPASKFRKQGKVLRLSFWLRPVTQLCEFWLRTACVSNGELGNLPHSSYQSNIFCSFRCIVGLQSLSFDELQPGDVVMVCDMEVDKTCFTPRWKLQPHQKGVFHALFLAQPLWNTGRWSFSQPRSLSRDTRSRDPDDP